jgi:septal ring factor EnvC (AmiA/AmiB activator)
MSHTSQTNTDFTYEIYTTIENLKQSKEEIIEEISKAEVYKSKLKEKLEAVDKEIERLSISIDEKKKIYTVYDKIIKDSDNAYSTILKSTEALYYMVKNEEKRVPHSRKNEGYN